MTHEQIVDRIYQIAQQTDREVATRMQRDLFVEFIADVADNPERERTSQAKMVLLAMKVADSL